MASASNRCPSAAVDPEGSPSTPLALTARTPCSQRMGRSVPMGRRSPASARSRCTRSGAMASIREVSVRPACRSPRHLGDHAPTRRPSAPSLATARVTGSALPPWVDTTRMVSKATAGRPTQLDQDQFGDLGPDGHGSGKVLVLATGSVGQPRGPPPASRPVPAAPSARATAMSVSVLRGRWGPCCSVEPTGTSRTLPVSVGSDRSDQVIPSSRFTLPPRRDGRGRYAPSR